MKAPGLDQSADAGDVRTDGAFAALLATMPDGVVLLDADRKVLELNRQAQQILGAEASDILGEAFVHPVQVGEVVEARIALGSGAVRLVEVRATRTEYHGAPATLVTLTALDDRQAFRNLQYRTEHQLRDLQRMETLGALASALAHDYNNLFTVVLGRCDLLERHARSLPGATEHLEQIRLGMERAGGLTSQFMALVDRGQTGLQSLDLRLVLGEMKSVLSASLGSAIALDMDLPPDLWSTRGERRLIEHAITNVVRNAREAIEGVGRVAIEARNVDLDGRYAATHPGVRPGSYVRIAISDDGCGIERDIIRRAFEPFFTTKGAAGSRGLGLTMAYGIVKEHGGNIWIYGEPGMGTVVKLYLPRDHAGAVQLAPSRLRPRLRRAHQRLSILIVEDEEVLAQTIERLLREQEHEVTCAPDGPTALRALERLGGQVDLVLCDVVLPDLGGRDLVSRIKERVPAVPVLMMSGYTDDEVVRQKLIDPDAPYLQKPFSPDELLDRIADLV